MTKPSIIYKTHEIIVIPFPYTDNIARSKRRPAVVLSDEHSFNLPTGQLICAMITSGKSLKWLHDIPILDLSSAGLDKPCVIRLKLFTIDLRFVLRKAGVLSKRDKKALGNALQSVLPIA